MVESMGGNPYEKSSNEGSAKPGQGEQIDQARRDIIIGGGATTLAAAVLAGAAGYGIGKTGEQLQNALASRLDSNDETMRQRDQIFLDSLQQGDTEAAKDALELVEKYYRVALDNEIKNARRLQDKLSRPKSSPGSEAINRNALYLSIRNQEAIRISMNNLENSVRDNLKDNNAPAPTNDARGVGKKLTL